MLMQKNLILHEMQQQFVFVMNDINKRTANISTTNNDDDKVKNEENEKEQEMEGLDQRVNEEQIISLNANNNDKNENKQNEQGHHIENISMQRMNNLDLIWQSNIRQNEQKRNHLPQIEEVGNGQKNPENADIADVEESEHAQNNNRMLRNCDKSNPRNVAKRAAILILVI